MAAPVKATATPGPWHMRTGVCRNDHPDTSADVHGAHGQFVADCGCHEWANANARLIAAAPELHAVAVEAEDWFDNHGDENDPGAMGLLQMFRAVIAKAEGR
jgi:hypothetical protein